MSSGATVKMATSANGHSDSSCFRRGGRSKSRHKIPFLKNARCFSGSRSETTRGRRPHSPVLIHSRQSTSPEPRLKGLTSILQDPEALMSATFFPDRGENGCEAGPRVLRDDRGAGTGCGILRHAPASGSVRRKSTRTGRIFTFATRWGGACAHRPRQAPNQARAPAAPEPVADLLPHGRTRDRLGNPGTSRCKATMLPRGGRIHASRDPRARRVTSRQPCRGRLSLPPRCRRRATHRP